MTSLYRFGDARRGARAARTPSTFGLSAAIFTRDLARGAAVRERGAGRHSCTSTRRRPAPTCTCRSAASRAPASARTSRAARRSSSTRRSSRSTRTCRPNAGSSPGALGCIGAWIVQHARRARAQPVAAFDLGRRAVAAPPDRMSRTSSPASRLVRGDVTDLDGLGRALDEHEVTHVVHLAALLIPLRARRPDARAPRQRRRRRRTSSGGEAAARADRGLAYASSAAVYVVDAEHGTARTSRAVGHPTTLYGVQQARQRGHGARLLGRGRRLPSIGLRLVHRLRARARHRHDGPAPTLAMAAAALRRAVHDRRGRAGRRSTTRPMPPALSSTRREPRHERRAGLQHPGRRTCRPSEVVAAIERGGSRRAARYDAGRAAVPGGVRDGRSSDAA